MQMRQHVQDIYKVLTGDETLLRLLYYEPYNPLDTSNDNILDMPELEKWKIIRDRIKTTRNTDELDVEPKCRLCFFPGRRKGARNYLVSDQEFVFDILTHFDFDDYDQRLSWISDRINYLIFDKNIINFGKFVFEDGFAVNPPVAHYSAYELIYTVKSNQGG